jgi:hypothetical protein
MGEMADRLFHDDVADPDDLAGLFGDADDLRPEPSMPFCGWLRRISASKPAMPRPSRLTIGCR